MLHSRSEGRALTRSTSLEVGLAAQGIFRRIFESGASSGSHPLQISRRAVEGRQNRLDVAFVASSCVSRSGTRGCDPGRGIDRAG
jgi:hypothetical protein